MLTTVNPKINLFRQFWESQREGPVLIGIRLPSDHAALYGVNHGKFTKGILQPDEIHAELFLDAIEESYKYHTDLNDDMNFTITPWWGIPWTEVIMGCIIKNKGGVPWAEPWLEGYDDLNDDISNILVLQDNKWVKKLLEFINVLSDHAEGRYSVGPAVLRIGADVVAALRGTEIFFL